MTRLKLAEARFRAALESVENAAGTVGENLDQAAKLPERVAELKKTMVATWKEIEAEGPSEWWLGAKGRAKGGKVAY